MYLHRDKYKKSYLYLNKILIISGSILVFKHVKNIPTFNLYSEYVYEHNRDVAFRIRVQIFFSKRI